MKFRLATTILLVVGLAVAAVSVSATTTTTPAKAADTGTWPIDTYGAPRATDNAILKWDEQLLSTIRAYPAQTGPTIASRALGVLHTATYDAWAAYDPVAKMTRSDGAKQQPASSNTVANKSKAISFAAYKVLSDLFPDETFPPKGPHTSPKNLMASLGYSLTDTTTPATV